MDTLRAAEPTSSGGRAVRALIGSEFEPEKAAQARRHLSEAGLADLVDIREGDALHSLAHDLPPAVDLVLLDGAKQLYLPVLTLLEPHLSTGAVVVADNTDDAIGYLDHVRHSPAYVSTDLGCSVELSVRT